MFYIWHCTVPEGCYFQNIRAFLSVQRISLLLRMSRNKQHSQEHDEQVLEQSHDKVLFEINGNITVMTMPLAPSIIAKKDINAPVIAPATPTPVMVKGFPAVSPRTSLDSPYDINNMAFIIEVFFNAAPAFLYRLRNCNHLSCETKRVLVRLPPLLSLRGNLQYQHISGRR